MKIQLKNLVITIPLLTSSLTSYAAFNPKNMSGAKTAFSNGDVCIQTAEMPNAKYSEKDKEKSQKLCSIDFIANDAIGICPKLHNTNPAFEIHTLKDSKKNEFEKSQCSIVSKSGGRKEKKLAKFKMTMTCSYAPSLITYYHISRALGDIVNVPVSVYRTLPRKYTAQKAALAAQASKAIASQLKTKAASDNAIIWNSTATKLASSAIDEKYITADGQFSFGSIVENPTNEEDYLDIMNHAGGIQLERGKAFMKEQQYLDVSNSKTVSDIISSNEANINNVQRMANMMDISDMIIIDTLLNQEDRYNNIAYEEDYYFTHNNAEMNLVVEDDGSFKKASKEDMASKNEDDLNQASAQSQNEFTFTPIKRIVIKDNDCGVARSNINTTLGIFKNLKHIRPDTYQKFLKLALEFKNDNLKTYFINELNLTAQDYSSIKTNALTMGKKLYEDCHAGNLHQDLSFKTFFGKQDSNNSCDLITQ